MGMGSAGGGGSSGAVSHSAYLETIHKDWLNNSGGSTLTTENVTAVMASAIGSSPWTGLTAYNPAADIAAYEATLAAFGVILAGLSDTVDWAALYTQAELTLDGPGNAKIIADIIAYENQLDDNITTRVLPRFRRGMQDINAVVSSAFVIGEAVIEAFQARDVAKYSSVLYLASNDKKITATDQMIQMMARRVGWNEAYAKTIIEANRIKIVALKEQTDGDATIDESDAKWDLEVFQYGANLMAAIGGGTAIPNLAKKNMGASVLGGAIAGGVAGAYVGGPVGAGVGAVIGAAVGFMGAS
jgi:hypothetical protein